jgi:hypothetical protein
MKSRDLKVTLTPCLASRLEKNTCYPNDPRTATTTMTMTMEDELSGTAKLVATQSNIAEPTRSS